MTSEVLTLGFLCEAIVDCEHKTAPIEDEGIPSIRTTDIQDGVIDFKKANKISEETYREWTKRREPKEGDLIFCREAPVGEVGRLRKGERAALGQRTVLLCPDKQKIDSRYLHYLLMGYELQYLMDGWSTGSTVAHLNVADIRKLPIPHIHNMKEQKIIGGLLDKFDILRLKLNETSNISQQCISAVFRSWFIDFDPVKAKSQGKLLYGMDKETAALFPDSFEGSELGPIPTGWRIEYLADLCDIQRGFSYTGASLCEQSEGIAMINLASFVEGGGYKHTGLKYISSEYNEKFYIKRGDVFIATVDLTPGLRVVGSPLIAPSSLENESIFSQDLLRLRIKTDKKIGYGFLFHWLKIRRGILKQWSSGTTVSRFPVSALNRYPVLIPPREILQHFENIFNNTQKFFDMSQTKMTNLSHTRDSLLPRLMSGELKVT